MRKLSLLALLTALASSFAGAQTATLHIQADKFGPRLSPVQHGIFFEEINHAGDGGLYAEKLRNRDFQASDQPDPWKAIGSAVIAVDESHPLHPRNARSLRIDIPAGAIPSGVENPGYWGIALKKGESYRFSVWARAAKPGAMLQVNLKGPESAPLAAARVGPLTTEWKQYPCRLRARSSEDSASLQIAPTQPGTFWIDMASLFPQKTFRNRSNGLRTDLAQKVADLKPSFARFPGGCFVEGQVLANRFQWKETLGDISERPGRICLWGYRSSDGLGYHEYLQMCEDIGAEPLFVVNCGMSHEEVVPMDQMGPYVQDALDAIEYATGPVTSQWGALRAKNGHPAPFRLNYMEIGNENGGPAYNDRYALFYDAIKAKYPKMHLIACVWGGTPKSRPIDILDEHYYVSPDWFFANSHKYDSYDRKGPKIYVGEYAVTEGCGLGNLQAALGEAAWMMGMERNADVVAMGSYAPLFVNVNDRKWNPDAIVYDSAHSFGTPSYHVQRLFSAYRPNVNLATTLEAPVRQTTPSGGIGVGTWRTQAEYRDISVTHEGKTLYQSDFSAGTEGWTPLRGEWKVVDGVYRQTDDGENVRAIVGTPNWSTYTLRLKARKLSGAEGFLILFHAKDDSHWYWWNVGGWNNTLHALQKSDGVVKSNISPQIPGSVETGRWYDVRVEVDGRHFRCYLDDRLVQEAEEPVIPTMAAHAGLVKKTGEILVKVVNASDDARETEINVDGAGKLAPTARMLVMTGGANEENTLSQPDKIVPVPQTLTGISPHFRHTFPPHSLTFLWLKKVRN